VRRRLLILLLLGALPLLGRDVRVAKAVTDSATHTVRSTGKVVSALQRSRRDPRPNVEPEGL
jgi:hypothetical protein